MSLRVGFRVLKPHARPSISLFLLPVVDPDVQLSHFSRTMAASRIPCSCLDENGLNL